MPKPFPFPITIGTDICHVNRIYNILDIGLYITSIGRESASVKAKKFVYKVLNTQEVSDAVENGRLHYRLLENCASTDNELGRLKAMAKFIGGRFAAKEAIIKAHPSLRLTFQDITVLGGGSEPDGRSRAPTAIIKALENNYGATPADEHMVPLSISHDGEYATAVALGLSTSLEKLLTRKVPVHNLAGFNPLYGPPPHKKSSNPKFGIYTVIVDNLSPLVSNTVLLDLFRQHFSSVRWVTVKSTTLRENDEESGQGFVTFGFRTEARRAVKELTGHIFMGQSIKVVRAARNMNGTSEEGGSVWLHNDLLEPLPEAETQEQEELIRTKPLPPLQSVFQDDPVIITKPSKSSQSPGDGSDRFLSSWNTEEIIQSGGWDSIQGESVDPVEVSDLMRMLEIQEEKKKVALREEMKSFESRLRLQGSKVPRFKVPKARKGFFIEP